MNLDLGPGFELLRFGFRDWAERAMPLEWGCRHTRFLEHVKDGDHLASNSHAREKPTWILALSFSLAALLSSIANMSFSLSRRVLTGPASSVPNDPVHSPYSMRSHSTEPNLWKLQILKLELESLYRRHSRPFQGVWDLRSRHQSFQPQKTQIPKPRTRRPKPPSNQPWNSEP